MCSNSGLKKITSDMMENWVEVMTRGFSAYLLVGLSDSASLVMLLLAWKAFGIVRTSGFPSNGNSRCHACCRSFSSRSVASYGLSQVLYIFGSLKCEST